MEVQGPSVCVQGSEFRENEFNRVAVARMDEALQELVRLDKMVTDDPSSLAVISNRGWALPDDTGDSMSDDVRVAATRRESIGYATSFGWTTLISKACPTGYVASSARVSCTPCPPGQVANRAGTSCEEWCVIFWHQ